MFIHEILLLLKGFFGKAISFCVMFQSFTGSYELPRQKKSILWLSNCWRQIWTKRLSSLLLETVKANFWSVKNLSPSGNSKWTGTSC